MKALNLSTFKVLDNKIACLGYSRIALFKIVKSMTEDIVITSHYEQSYYSVHTGKPQLLNSIRYTRCSVSFISDELTNDLDFSIELVGNFVLKKDLSLSSCVTIAKTLIRKQIE